jgi:ATP-dependent DNA helicase DinG
VTVPGGEADVPQVEELLDLAVTALGGRRRDGQRAMVTAVSRAIDRHEHLLVQAGTGTGKSLGYLVPAVRHAVLSDERVVVSTATLALQRQVMARDLPLVAAAVSPRLPRPPQIALLKGWHNYLCRHRIAGGYPEEEPAALFDAVEGVGAAEHPRPERSSLAREVVRVRAWAEETATGDRDDLVPGVSDRAWRQVSVTSMDCLGRHCPLIDECFPEQAKTRAHEADVVVTNHAMLGIAASGSPGVLPEHTVLVVDEGHELADRVTAQATAELSQTVVERAARLARRHGGVPGDDLVAAASGLGAALLATPPGRIRDGLTGGLAGGVTAVRDAARALLTALRPDGASTDGAEGGRKMATSAVLVVFEVAERMAGDARDVLWTEGDEIGAPATRLLAAPLDVASLVRGGLVAGRAAILTSATLSLGGSFLPLARAVGLRPGEMVDEGATPTETGDTADPADGVDPADALRAEPAVPVGPAGVDPAGSADPAGADPADSEPVPGGERPSDGPQPWRGLDVGSPFDHRRHGILYVARHLPPPGREPATEAQLDEIADLVTAAGGATLGLFSSRRAAVVAAEAMRSRLDVPVLCQGEDSVPSLVRRFVDDDATCLFGTLSLWQGIDVPGAACRLVIVDRIPFPRPDDPIRSARTEAVEAAGGNGFMAVSAAQAALLLAQGSGRLLRTETDRGVVAVLDPRLVTARYGTFLLRSMPPFWRTTDRTVVLEALGRLAAADAGA